MVLIFSLQDSQSFKPEQLNLSNGNRDVFLEELNLFFNFGEDVLYTILQLHACSIFLISFFFKISFSEKHKAEIKDGKVLEILQAKDFKIQELEQVPHSLSQQLSLWDKEIIPDN